MQAPREPNAEPIPGYRLIEFLGRGGFGEAWKCEAPGGLFKAIKFVSSNLKSLEAGGARAQQELQALQRVKAIRHPFILSMDRVEVVGDDLVIVMELADKSLNDRLKECQGQGMAGIPREELLAYLAEAAEALDVMNLRHGLQHLDVKPHNLFLVAEHIKVADFGLVKCLSDGANQAGSAAENGGITPLYAPPETLRGAISPQSDQYSLALVYQELLTGRLPFEGKNSRQLALQHLHEEPNLGDLPEADRPAVARALAKDPAQRFPSCQDFIQALALGHGPAQDRAAAAGAGQSTTTRLIRRALTQSLAGAYDAATTVIPPGGVDDVPPDGAVEDAVEEPVRETPAARQSMVDTAAGRPLTTCEALPGYQFVACLGRDAFGELWKVEAPRGREQLLRFLPTLPGRDANQAKVCLQRLLSLNHPRLPAAELIQTKDGRLVLLTDTFEQTLQDRLSVCQAEGERGIPRLELLEHLGAAADALDFFHEDQDLAHLALTPRALVLSKGRLVLTDLGLASLYRSQASVMTAPAYTRYAAPELLAGQMTPACDQYSLALIYCELLTGVHPYRGQSLQRLARGRARPAPNLDLLTAHDREALVHALHPDPSQRYPSCGELVDALEGADAVASLRTPLVASAPTIEAAPAHTLVHEDPRTALDCLNRILSEMGQAHSTTPSDVGQGPQPSAEFLEQRCGARIYGQAIRLKLEGFRQQWNARIAREQPNALVYFVGLGHSMWRRCLGKEEAGLQVAIHLVRPRILTAHLAEIVIRITAVHCARVEGARLLAQAGPLLLKSIRSYLQATPERRTQDRLAFAHTVQVSPVFPGMGLGEAVPCQGKDISLGGVGFYLPQEPPAREIVINLPVGTADEVIALPAEVVRLEQCADGQFEIGARFAFGGLAAGESECRQN
jgi:serine/threonine protein kinase